MDGRSNWPQRNMPVKGDGGANAARFPYPPQSHVYGVPGSRDDSALRAGVNKNFEPGASSTVNGYSAPNNFTNGSNIRGDFINGIPVNGAHVNTSLRPTLPKIDQISIGVNGNHAARQLSFNTGYISPRPDSDPVGDIARKYRNGGAKVESPSLPTPPSRVNSVPRRNRDSVSSVESFATQLPQYTKMAPSHQNTHVANDRIVASQPLSPTRLAPSYSNGQTQGNGIARAPQNVPSQAPQHGTNGMPQLRQSMDHNVYGIAAGLGNMRISNLLNAPSNGSSMSTAAISRDSLSPTEYHSESTARRLAEMIKHGETEDPFDRNMRDYTTAPRVANPVLGPARFKDSKMFATIESTTITVPNQAIGPVKKGRPDWINLAKEGLMVPNLDEAFDALPLEELCRGWSNHTAGVIRIKDIPYATTRQEMIAFIGRNAQIQRQPAGSPYHAVHILMERESGKTMDCFIEVSTSTEAAWVARQFARRIDQKRPPKVGDRVVEVVYSSQDELMFELFPRAKHVRWSNGQPVVDRTQRAYYKNQPALGFQGFLHPEELVALNKHATLFERSPFASKSPARVYEAMITLLHKYPWQAIEEVTIGERRAIYEAAISLVKNLITVLRRSNGQYNPVAPTPALLQELTTAALVCPGFTEKQKASIINVVVGGGYKGLAEGRDLSVKLGGHHELSASWPFSALGLPYDAEHDVLSYYAALFRQATSNSGPTSLAARKAAQSNGQPQAPMGNWNIDYGNNPSALSLAQVGKIEYDAVERVLQTICRDPAQGHQEYNSLSAPSSIGRGSSSSGSGSAGQTSISTYYSLR